MALAPAHRAALASCAENFVASLPELADGEMAVVSLNHDGRVGEALIYGDRHAARIAQRRFATRHGVGAVVRDGRASVLAYGL